MSAGSNLFVAASRAGKRRRDQATPRFDNASDDEVFRKGSFPTMFSQGPSEMFELLESRGASPDIGRLGVCADMRGGSSSSSNASGRSRWLSTQRTGRWQLIWNWGRHPGEKWSFSTNFNETVKIVGHGALPLRDFLMLWCMRIRFASRLLSRPRNALVLGIELVVARPTQKLSTRQRRTALWKTTQRSPRTLWTDVAEPEPLLFISKNLQRLRVLRVSHGAPYEGTRIPPCPPEAVRQITRERSEAGCGEQEGDCAYQRGRAGRGRHPSPGLAVARGKSRQGRQEGPAQTPFWPARSRGARRASGQGRQEQGPQNIQSWGQEARKEGQHHRNKQETGQVRLNLRSEGDIEEVTGITSMGWKSQTSRRSSLTRSLSLTFPSNILKQYENQNITMIMIMFLL